MDISRKFSTPVQLIIVFKSVFQHLGFHTDDNFQFNLFADEIKYDPAIDIICFCVKEEYITSVRSRDILSLSIFYPGELSECSHEEFIFKSPDLVIL